MTVDDANRIIAEYMGHDAYNLFKYPNCTVYSESLDIMVPVWENLGVYESSYFWSGYDCKTYECCYTIFFHNKTIPTESMGRAKKIQRAACIATAKAIQELGGEGCE